MRAIWESEVRCSKRAGWLVEKVGVGPGCRIWMETKRKMGAQCGQKVLGLETALVLMSGIPESKVGWWKL